jgi:hypothetical protein
MIKITDYMENEYRGRNVGEIDFTSLHVITSPKHHLMGLSLKEDFIVINVKYYYSFRLKLHNIAYLSKFTVFRCKQPVDLNYLEKYFAENKDNPFAVQNVMNCIPKGRKLENLTQFPPLNAVKNETNQKRAIEHMYNEARIGDSIFTFNRKSGISRYIRKIDKGPWSHVGLVDKDKNIVEMTTSGIAKSDFLSLCDPSLDVGLYRIRGLTPDNAEQDGMQKFLDDLLREHAKFDWFAIFLIFLHKKLHLPVKHVPTPADLMYSNNLELISYA